MNTKNLKICVDPYPHALIECASNDIDLLCADWPEDSEFSGSIRMHLDLTFGDKGYDTLLEKSRVFNALHSYVYSEAFVTLFLKIFDESIEACLENGELLFDPRRAEIKPHPIEQRAHLSAKKFVGGGRFLFPRMDLGVGKLGYGLENGGGGIHTDNASRLISILFFIDADPLMIGGEHRMYSICDGTPVLAKIYFPKKNLLIASLQTNRALHDVNPITKLGSSRKAIYMAISASEDIWAKSGDEHLQKLTKNRYHNVDLKLHEQKRSRIHGVLQRYLSYFKQG